MSLRAEIRRELRANPTIRNRVLVKKYGCSAAVVSQARKELGLSLQSWQVKPHYLSIPVYMLEPLGEMARETGKDVTINDVIIGILDDLIAEHRACEAAE